MTDSPSFIRAQIAYDNMSPDDGIEFDPDGKIEASIRKNLYVLLRPNDEWEWTIMDGDQEIDGNTGCDSIQEAAGDAERELEAWVAKQMEREQDDAMEGDCGL